MSTRRDLRLDRFEIRKNAYRELYYFCLQYPEKKALVNNIRSLSTSPATVVVKGGDISNPTERKALKSATPAEDCRLIETTAMEAAPQVHSWILKAVTLDLTWEYLQPPMGRRQFYECRRRFFYLLALKKGMI